MDGEAEDSCVGSCERGVFSYPHRYIHTVLPFVQVVDQYVSGIIMPKEFALISLSILSRAFPRHFPGPFDEAGWEGGQRRSVKKCLQEERCAEHPVFLSVHLHKETLIFALYYAVQV